MFVFIGLKSTFQSLECYFNLHVTTISTVDVTKLDQYLIPDSSIWCTITIKKDQLHYLELMHNGMR